ncbi:MAG: GRAM domain-containing protein [Verrucomicrobiota bacterium]
MKSFARTALSLGIPFGLFMGIYFVLRHGLISGVIAGVACGIFFGVSMGAFAKYQKKKFHVTRPLFEDEVLIKEGGANHFKNMEGVGGWIYLTDKRMLFKSHSVNIQNHELSISLDEIRAATECMTFGIIPNGLKIQTSDGNEEKFVVEGRRDWVKNIIEAKTQIA